MPDGVVFYPVWVTLHAAHGRSPYCWGAPCDSPGEAARVGREKVRVGDAVRSFVVEFAGGEKTPLASWTYPKGDCKVIESWEGLWDATEGPETP